MSHAQIEDLEGQHEADRASAARASYIRWRMMDLPAIYTNLMPPTYDAKVLWEAERCIRAQYENDLKLADDPWRHLGPPPQLLDTSNLDANELIKFGASVSMPVGWKDIPKPGFEDDSEVAAITTVWKQVKVADEDSAIAHAWTAVQDAQEAMNIASAAMVKASNNGGDENEIAKLEAAYNATIDQHESAMKEYRRLQANPTEAYKPAANGGPKLAE